VYIAHHRLPLAAIRDGMSNTYLLGEKYLDPNQYLENSTDLGDNHSAWTGLNWDTTRTTQRKIATGALKSEVPMRDKPGIVNYWTFGSAHPSSFGMAFCDGSVRGISYNIDAEVHRRLGNRHDGLAVDGDRY